MDMPRTNMPLPTHIHSMGEYSGAASAFTLASVSLVSYNWPAQELAVYIPMAIPFDYPIARIFVANGSAAGGNWDFGIYTLGGGKIFSSGEFAASGNSQCQYQDVTDFILSAGAYYFGLENDSATTTNRAWGNTGVTANEGRLGGLLQEALGSGNALKQTATFAQWANTGWPLCGITRTASGF